MKVKELIEILQSKDQEKEIFVYNEEYGQDEPITGVYQNENSGYFITGSY